MTSGHTIAAYLSHPLGDIDSPQLYDSAHEIDNCLDWFRFLVTVTQWAIHCPWLAYVVALGDAFTKERVLRDQIEYIRRTDVILQCGGRIAPHMLIERNHATKLISAVPVVNLTDLGRAPPWDRLEETRHQIIQRAIDATGYAVARR